MSSVVRRVLLLVMFMGAMAAATTWWRGRGTADDSDEPARWPPLDPGAEPGTSNAPTTAVRDADDAAPESAATWRPADGGPAPEGYPIKVKESSGIFHEPGGRFYDRTQPDRWYVTAEAAEADGYRRSKT